MQRNTDAHRSIVLKYAFLLDVLKSHIMTLDVLNKNENIVNAGYWVLQSVLVAKISSRKTKKSPIRKNKVPQKFRATHGIYGQENRLLICFQPVFTSR